MRFVFFFFFFSFPLRLGHHKKQTLPKCGWMRALRSILHSFGDRNLFLWSKNFSFPFMLFNAFKAISSSNKVSSKAQPRYVTWESCFTLIFYSFPALLILCLLAKRTDLVLSSPKCMLNLLSTNQSQTFSKSLFSYFSVFLTSLCCCMRYESSVCKNRFNFTV